MYKKSKITVISELRDFLQLKRKLSFEDPSINPISSLAHDVSRKLVSGELDFDIISSIIESLAEELTNIRIVNLSNIKNFNIENLVNKISEKNKLTNFKKYKKFWMSLKIGTVFTAHPTFNISNKTWQKIVNETQSPQRTNSFHNLKQRRTNKTSLVEEHKAVIAAINYFWDARHKICNEVLIQGNKRWPGEFKVFIPNIINCSTWVGYDLDGRTDIKWIDSFIFRLEEKYLMLQKVDRQLNGVITKKNNKKNLNIMNLSKKCKIFISKTSELLEIIKSDNQLKLKLFQEKFDQLDSQYFNSKTFAIKIMNIAKIEKDKKLSHKLILIASEISNRGFGIGEIQLRFNALQLHNALRGTLEISTESASVRTDLNRLSKLIDEVKVQKLNFFDIDDEPTTAKRQLMLASLILKYIDKSTPIRILIAECEHPATIITALYFAKKYGVEKLLDISPLFETSISIERGARIMEQALDCIPFLENIILRKRITIQTGFSDAGRFMGQITSALAVERLQVKLSEVISRKLKKNIEVVIFNTHGESIGRGGHPNGIEERNKYIFSSFARKSFTNKGFKFKHETSFQGGDGFLKFGNDKLSLNTICSILETELIPDNFEEDILYADTDFSLDFFITLKNWHENLYSNPDYWQFLDLYSNNLLVPSGSRPNKRTNEFTNERKDPSQIRAISHNAILQQFGYLAHIAGGLGTSVNIDIEKFDYFKKYSKRFKQLLDVGIAAKKLSSLNTPLAYILILDQSYWVGRSYSNSEKPMRKAFRKLSRALKNDVRFEAVKRLINILRDDALDFHSIASSELNLHPEQNERVSLDLIQSLRISLMAHALLITAKLPNFSARDNLTPENLLLSAFKMDLETVISQIKIAFPRIAVDRKFEKDINLKDEYRNIQEDFINPLSICNDLILETGVLISHAFNAHG